MACGLRDAVVSMFPEFVCCYYDFACYAKVSCCCFIEFDVFEVRGESFKLNFAMLQLFTLTGLSSVTK